MGQADPTIGMLKDIGFVTVRLPRVNLKPLQVFEKSGNTLVERGEVSNLFRAVGSTRLPQISPDEQMGNVNGKRTSDLKIGVGLTILGGIIKSMGGNLGFETEFSRAKTAAFEFENVLGNKINVFELEEYLSVADLNHNLTGAMSLLEADKLYVVTSVIKSNKFIFETKSDSNTSVGAEVPVISQIVGGNVKVEKKSENSAKISFGGQQPLVFGISAVQMVFDDGVFKLLKEAKPGSVATRSIRFAHEDKEQEFQTLNTDAPFIGLKMNE